MQPDEREKGHRLVAAAAKGEVEVLRALLAEGTDVHFEQDLALRSAAFTGQMEALKLLVASGADVSARFHEALFAAAKAGDSPMVDFLVENGADAAIAMKFYDKKMDAPCRSLLLACVSRDSSEKAKRDQSLIEEIAGSARDSGVVFDLRPPAPRSKNPRN